jgi:hypothetical protein
LLAETKGLAGRQNGRFFDHFVMKLDDGFAKDFKNDGATLGQMIVAASTFGLADRSLRTEPAIALETLQQRVQGAGTDVVTMLAQLAQHPLADDRMLGGVMEDVHLPEAQQDFAGEKLRIKVGHGAENIITIAVNETRNEHRV